MSKGKTPSPETNFLGRWSRRKLGAETQPQPDGQEGGPADGDDTRQPGQSRHNPGRHKPGRMITDAPMDHELAEPSATDSSGHDVMAPGQQRQANIATDTAADADAAAASSSSKPDAAGHDSAPAEDDFSDVDFDALDAESDYTRFMGDHVPEQVRGKALKKLWSSNPIFGQLDGLDDYAEDFTDAAWVVEDLRTSYRVGRGLLDDEELAEWEVLGSESKRRADEQQGRNGDKNKEQNKDRDADQNNDKDKDKDKDKGPVQK